MKKTFVAILLILILIFSISGVFAQGYKIKVKINGIQDTTLMLGHHFGGKKYVKDTVQIDKNGIAIFKGEEKLPGGIYIVVLPGMTYFEILINGDQNFSVETDTTDFVNNMKISGSVENQLFNDYQRYMVKQQKKLSELRKELEKINDDSDSTKIIKEQLKKVDKGVKDYWNKILIDYPNTFLSKIIKAMINPEIPEPPVDEEGNITDSLFQYRYYKEHFFDNIDFSDDRLLRTPIFENKIKQFFTKTVMKVPDSIIVEADRIIEKSKANKDVFRYVVVYLLNYYETTKIMGMDKVFVSIAEKYYLTGEAYWADSTMLAKFEERVRKLKPTLIGEIAHDIKMQTNTGEYVTLHQVNAKYTILVFWEPDCGHCKKVVPKIYKISEKFKDKGVKAFAVYTQADKEEWLKFINEHSLDWLNVYDPYHLSNYRNFYDIYSTPVIYLLNEKKEIVAKRLAVEQIEKLLNRFLEKE